MIVKKTAVRWTATIIKPDHVTVELFDIVCHTVEAKKMLDRWPRIIFAVLGELQRSIVVPWPISTLNELDRFVEHELWLTYNHGGWRRHSRVYGRASF